MRTGAENSKDLSRLDKVLNKLVVQDEAKPCTQLTSFGPNTLLSLVESEVKKISDLGNISDQLIAHFCSPLVLNRLSPDDKRKLLMDISELQRDSRDFILKFTDMANKNAMLSKLLKPQVLQPEIIITEQGHQIIDNAASLAKEEAIIGALKGLLDERHQQQ